jgi:hypothetical protein
MNILVVHHVTHATSVPRETHQWELYKNKKIEMLFVYNLQQQAFPKKYYSNYQTHVLCKNVPSNNPVYYYP